MPLDTFPLLQNQTRLIRYNDTLYKIKIIYDLTTLNCTQLDEQSAHYDIEQIFRAVLYKNERNDPLKPIVTSRFLVKPLKIPWCFPVKHKNYKFTQHGKALKVYEYLFEFHVSKNTILTSSNDEIRTTNNNVNHSATKKETNVEKNDDTAEEVVNDDDDDEERVEDSGIKRVLRYHRDRDGILVRESFRRGKSPVFGNKKIKKSFDDDKIKVGVSTKAKDKNVALNVGISKPPVRNERGASKKHLDVETKNENVTELFHDLKKAFKEQPKDNIPGSMVQKKKSTPVLLSTSVKRNKFSVKSFELKSLGTVQECRLRNRNRVQSRNVNQRSGRRQSRHTHRISERRPSARTRAKIQNDLKSDDSSEVSANEVEKSNDEVKFGKNRITRNFDSRKHPIQNKIVESVDKRRERNSENNLKEVYVRHLRSSVVGTNHKQSLIISSEDSSSVLESSVGSDVELENRQKSATHSAVNLIKKQSSSSENECSPKKPRLEESVESDDASQKNTQSRKVKLYATKNMLNSGAGVMEIVSPRVSTVQPIKRKSPVKSTQNDQIENVQTISPRVTRKSLQNSESHKLEMVRNRMRSRAYADIMQTIVKDGNKADQETTEHQKEQAVNESTIYRRSPRHQTDKFPTQRHSPRLAIAGRNKRRSSGLWGKIMDTFVNPTTSFMFGNKKDGAS